MITINIKHRDSAEFDCDCESAILVINSLKQAEKMEQIEREKASKEHKQKVPDVKIGD